MNLKDIREKSIEALGQELAAKQRHMFDLRSQAVTEKLENPMQLRVTRRDIAQLKTIIREKELAQQS
ncbi:MAG: 50S ribosomal protein L29 [Phycisphaerae bacterium]